MKDNTSVSNFKHQWLDLDEKFTQWLCLWRSRLNYQWSLFAIEFEGITDEDIDKVWGDHSATLYEEMKEESK